MLNEAQEPERKLIDIKWFHILNILFSFFKGAIHAPLCTFSSKTGHRGVKATTNPNYISLLKPVLAATVTKVGEGRREGRKQREREFSFCSLKHLF